MSRKIVGGLLVLGVLVIVVWFAFLRDRGHDARRADDHGRSAAIPATPVTPAKPPEPGPAPRGLAPRWTLDPDGEGPLRLEGQVLGPDGKGVGGAEVWLDSVPARTAKAEDDGGFS